MIKTKEIKGVFLMADLSGYTALTEAHGNMSAAKIVNRYVEIAKYVLQPGSNLVERVGDEILIMAPEAASIIRTAIGLRDTIEREPLFPTVHAGIHAGSVVDQEGHYFGMALNLASRVAAHARGGQILCTREVVTLASNLKDVEYRSLRPVRLKNVAELVEIFEVIAGREKKETKPMDPVCRMLVRQDTAPARLPFGGKTYFFCSLECAKAFANHPEHYVTN